MNEVFKFFSHVYLFQKQASIDMGSEHSERLELTAFEIFQSEGLVTSGRNQSELKSCQQRSFNDTEEDT